MPKADKVENPGKNFDIKEIAEKWLQGTISEEERTFFEEWYAGFNDEEVKLTGSRHTEPNEIRKAIWNKINAELNKSETALFKKPIFRLWPRIAAAASILLFLSAGGYFLLHKKPVQQIAQNQQHNIAPGRNQATLTLANGQKIILTKSLSGKIAQQGNTAIQINAQTGITYQGTDNGKMQYNTLSTAKGEVTPLPLILGDGTRVWLNAASSVTFPVAFAGDERRVTVTGEALFEVAHNAAKPFRVISGDQVIQDIGTSFDVNAYSDEPVLKTTLVEGSVKVSAGDQSVLLKPGQQSLLNGSKITIGNADIQETIAWKNGVFRFNAEKLSEIMLQASRWYDVDVVYDNDALKEKTFGAITTRFSNASGLLHVLEMTGEVKFKIEGKKITVFKP